MNYFNVGVLSIQGDIAENVSAVQKSIKKLNYRGIVNEINNDKHISKLDGLIIPGGESTTIAKLSMIDKLLKKLQNKINDGMPIFGICAGLILLSKYINDKKIGPTNQLHMDLLDIEVERNYFGRQKDSFESYIEILLPKMIKTKGIFIRSPRIKKVGNGVQILSKLNNNIIAVRQNNILATSFHPELTHDTILYEYFISMIQQHHDQTH
ncbi:MAG: pyridoxal 5'-phosphate synthase glutaminase subunit PdxT [Nitrosopumilaceae archaeon]|nr:pyridoxal 5'-phosphate synthase glutaminase subunit PdxT [Nitrosopumilaceae archaeon]